MNEFKRANLAKLADCLDTLPDDYDKFDMGTFNNQSYTICRSLGDCGTSACAVGHAPSFGFEIEADYDGFVEDWDEYAKRLFHDTEQEFEWMFDGMWDEIDNTPSGAASRIRWYLENGVPIDAWLQMLGEAPLCYKEKTK